MKSRKTDIGTPTSVRMTQETRDLAQIKAEKLHMSRNEFVTWAIQHADTTNSPTMKVRVQNAVNKAVSECLKGNTDAIFTLQKEIDEIW